MSKLKIGILCYPTYGGSGIVATELGNALAKEGHEIHFITYSMPPRLNLYTNNIYYHEVSIYSYPLFQYPPYELALASKIVDTVQFESLDILHVHYAIPHASAAYTAKQILAEKGIDIPIVTTLHGTDITLVGKDKSFTPVIEFSINKSDAVTAVSHSLKSDTYEHFHIKRDIEVIHNFVNNNFYQDVEEKFDRNSFCTHNEKLIIHISNFRKVKRVPDVVKVFGKVQETVPSKLLLIGDGPERANIEQLCRDLGCCDDVKFIGKINSVKEILSIADVFILPSEKESFGLAALEAMACGVPVISSDAGGLAELNEHGKTGFLAPVGDIDAMAKATIKVLDEKNLNIFKANALERALEFDISAILPKYINLYQSIIESAKSESIKGYK